MHTFKEGEAAARYRGIRLKALRSEHTTNVTYVHKFRNTLDKPSANFGKNKEEAMQQKLM